MGYAKSKNRSQDQILEKPCVCQRGHIFSLIIIKPGKNVCLDEISDEFENGTLEWVLEKPYVRFRCLIFSLIIMKLGQHVCLDQMSVKN